MKICGLDGKNKFYNEIDLFSNLYNVWTKKGKQPSRRDMDDKNISEISSGAYLRKFNKWSLALKAFINFINEDESISHPSHLNVEFKHKTARDINLRLRFKVFQRDNFKCKICGASTAINPSVILQVDHIIPYSKGEETILENLQTLCQKCNLGKSNL